MLPFISRRMRLFISTAYSTGSSRDTLSAKEFILRGIAKTHMIQACYRLGITVMEKCFTLDDLKNADEIIVTSSSNFCLHACEVDGKPAGGKDPETLKAIQDEVLREYYAYTGKTTVVD